MAYGPLDANPISSTIHLTKGTSIWLYVACAFMGLSTAIMAFLTRKRVRGTRIFHQLATVILAVSTVNYFSLASNLGSVPVLTTMRREGTRAIWYSRYIDWIITTPMLLLVLLLATGLPLGDITTILAFNIVMFACLLIGALISSDYKWGFFSFAIAAMLYVAYHILSSARGSARLMGLDWGRTFTRSSGLLVFTWALYPICWALSEGGNVMGASGEMIFYSILDILSKPVFLFMHVMAISKLPYADLGLTSGKYSDPVNSGVGHHHPLGNTTSHARSSVTAHGAGADVAHEHKKSPFGFLNRKVEHDNQTPMQHSNVAVGSQAPVLNQPTTTTNTAAAV
ncbi:hypothetical protein NliqN6_4023 [Naganishia liquefaciens]|uniref:Rhodopsin n=1 Tax=Naganishia liquefaciens TaxID=104408 RepID=A0A8H3TVB8_9TREE|nr:hypothetical protein NliqN6_4023 [Naganishia liquefaciens]